MYVCVCACAYVHLHPKAGNKKTSPVFLFGRGERPMTVKKWCGRGERPMNKEPEAPDSSSGSAMNSLGDPGPRFLHLLHGDRSACLGVAPQSL